MWKRLRTIDNFWMHFRLTVTLIEESSEVGFVLSSKTNELG